ncbi:PLP-dependent aminotransferase family protein [Roseiarcus sp.]|jgi:DNA-binding transcriptional MocR family regulator|uniref:aminotransferase-like domain-containing protein n=1 Tax=Roseiarcus sp. TaxID=1969460 RepID=UPI003D146879
MLSLNVVPREDRPLTDQIVMGVKRQIDDRQLRPGTRLPSIRNFAQTHGVSRFTVVEAYDRLVAMGCLQSRRGAGFYVAAPAAGSGGPVPAAPEAHRHNEELVWLIRRLLEAGDHSALAGGPWLPNSWQEESGIRHALGALARKNGAHLLEYGNPFGYLPLREHLALTLAEIGVAATAPQILLTQGTSQALDLVIRYLLKPGDCALVDDPGYYNMFGNLRVHGVEMLAIPRRPDGPDFTALEALAAARRPKVYFTQSAMQNPTGSNTSPHVAFRLLQAAESHDFTVVEDDIFCDLQSIKPPRLATLDQLNRVIYVRSFSKTLSGSLRVGFVASTQSVVDALADIKMLTCITTSQFTERLLYLMLVDGHYRKHLSRLRERLGEARISVVRAFERVGLEMFAEPTDGMFVWARLPNIADSFTLAESAHSEGILLAPGVVFRPHLERSPWMRFNVATCDDPRIMRWLERQLATARNRNTGCPSEGAFCP